VQLLLVAAKNMIAHTAVHYALQKIYGLRKTFMLGYGPLFVRTQVGWLCRNLGVGNKGAYIMPTVLTSIQTC